MKNIFLSMFAVAVCGAMTASAVDATSAQVTMVTKGSAIKVEKLNTPPSYSFPGEGLKTQPVVGWQVVNIPVKIEAKYKKDEKPQFIPSLKLKAYLLFESDTTDEKMELLSKEIQYCDVPVEATGADDSSKCEMSVGVFISPSNAVKINKKGKGDLKGKLLGVALEAVPSGKVKARMNTKEDCFVVYDNKLKGKLPTKWWNRKLEGSGAMLNSVNETPYAPFIGSFYPATEPRFGAAEMAQVPATPEEAPAVDGTPTTTTPADTTAGETPDAATTDTPAAEEKETKSSSRSRKGKGKRGSRGNRY